MRIFAMALVLALGLSGCAASPTYPASVAAALERRVVAVATDCADGQFTKALEKLADLQQAAATAQAKGDITPERQARIATAIDLVRQDLQSQITAAQQAALDGRISSLKDEQQKLAEQQKQADERQAEQEKQAEDEDAAPDTPVEQAPDDHPDDEAPSKEKPGKDESKPGKDGNQGKGGKH